MRSIEKLDNDSSFRKRFNITRSKDPKISGFVSDETKNEKNKKGKEKEREEKRKKEERDASLAFRSRLLYELHEYPSLPVAIVCFLLNEKRAI